MARNQNLSLVAVLGALSVEPMSGYEIRQAIATTLTHFWSESFGQIYPALRQLEERGLVEPTGDEVGRSRRYQITQAGRRELHARLTDLGPESPPRSRLLLQLFFGAELGPDQCHRLVAAQRTDAQGRLATFAAIRTEMAIEDQYAKHQPYWLLTLDAGERANRAFIEWADATLATLDTLTTNETDPGK